MRVRGSAGAEAHDALGVPDGTRDPQTGELVHDDLLISAALCTALEEVKWTGTVSGPALVVRASDPLEEMKGF